MARYTGPTCKLARREGVDLELKSGIRSIDSKCKLTQLPGVHGANARRKKGVSTVFSYVKSRKLDVFMVFLEKQFSLYYKKASSKKGQQVKTYCRFLSVDLIMLSIRMGFASTRAEARQLVSHKSIVVNGKVVNIPSFQVSANDEIAVREKAKKQSRIQLAVEISGQSGLAEWVDVDNKALKGVFKNVPARDELSSDISEQLIVELYSK